MDYDIIHAFRGRLCVFYYLCEYDQIIKEVDSGANITYNVYGLSLISKEENGDKAYYIYNGHGDVTAILSSTGVAIKSYYYDAFGNILEETGSFKITLGSRVTSTTAKWGFTT